MTMHIYPAIDLKDGVCVRLHQGSFDHVTYYNKDPVHVAKHFEQEGATFLHVVDLDGAKNGHCAHFDLVLKILQNTHLQLQVGGGIREKKQIIDLLNAGVSRVILGSIAVTQPEQVKKWLQEIGAEKIVLALDIRNNAMGEPQLATHGWQTNVPMILWDLLNIYGDLILKHVLCTDIDRDGTLQGPNITLYSHCQQRYPHLKWQASGGVSSLEDLQQLAKIKVSGAIIGKALYENRFCLQQAFQEIAKIC